MRTGTVAMFTLVACEPAWVHESYRPQAKADAITTAAHDHDCPVDRVRVRCDASTRRRAADGELVAYERGGVVGTYVDEMPQWAFELDVCGTVRRYGFVEGEYVEKQPEDASPCMNQNRDTWWAVEVAAPAACANASLDDELEAQVGGGYLEVSIANHRPKPWWLSTGCRSPSMIVAVDTKFYALCGGFSGGRIWIDPGTTVHVAPGLPLVAGHHRVEVLHLDGDTCHTSGPLDLVRKKPFAWID